MMPKEDQKSPMPVVIVNAASRLELAFNWVYDPGERVFRHSRDPGRRLRYQPGEARRERCQACGTEDRLTYLYADHSSAVEICGKCIGNESALPEILRRQNAQTPAHRLETLADLVDAEPERWCRGALFRDQRGCKQYYRFAHSACLMGFCNLAMDTPGDMDPDWPAARALAEALRKVGGHPGQKPNRDRFARWNDARARTPGEVAAALREAARLVGEIQAAQLAA